MNFSRGILCCTVEEKFCSMLQRFAQGQNKSGHKFRIYLSGISSFNFGVYFDEVYDEEKEEELEEDVRQREAFIFDTGYGAGA